MQEYPTTGLTLLLHTGQHILLVVVRHINGTYKVVGIESLESLFQLGVTNVSLEGVVGIRVTMTHESNNTLLSLGIVKSIQLLSNLRNIRFGVVQQRHTQEDSLIVLQLGQIFIVQMSLGNVTVVHELLNRSYNSCELLARDNLQRLNIDFAVLGSTDSMQQITGLVVIALYDVTIVIGILTDTCTVDADVAGEADINICLGESLLVSSLCLVESQERIVPCRTEGNQQNGYAFLGLGLLCGNQIVVVTVLRNQIFGIVCVVTTT